MANKPKAQSARSLALPREPVPRVPFSRTPFSVEQKWSTPAEPAMKKTEAFLKHEQWATRKVDQCREHAEYWADEENRTQSQIVRLETELGQQNLESDGGFGLVDPTPQAKALAKLRQQLIVIDKQLTKHKESTSRAEWEKLRKRQSALKSKMERLTQDQIQAGFNRMAVESKVERIRSQLQFLRSQKANTTRLVQKYREWETFCCRFAEMPVLEELFQRVGEEESLAFTAVAEVAQFNPGAIAYITRRAERWLFQLAALVVSGNAEAAVSLVKIAHFATRVTNETARQSPELLGNYARKCLDWPLLLSTKENFHPDAMGILKKLQLGSEAHFPIWAGAKWEKNDLTGKVAWELWHYVNHWRSIGLCLGEHSTFQVDDFTRNAADLQPFGEDTWEAWWRVARQAIEESCQEDDPTLRNIAAPRRDRSGIQKNQTYQDVLKISFRSLKERFKSFAGMNKKASG